MGIYYPKLSNMTHNLSLSVFISFRETNLYILLVSRFDLDVK